MRAAIISIAILAITVAVGATANADTIRFSIAPERANDGGAFFSYTLGPGLVIADTAIVRNGSATPLALRLYVADAVTATNGGTAFLGNGQFRDHTHTWIAATADQVTVPANGSVAVPFRVIVPSDVTAGDHIAGLVAEAAPERSTGGGFAAAVVQRAGVAIVVHIPGRTSSKLALGEVCLNQQSGSNYFQLVAANQGDVLTKAAGQLVLRTESGEEVFQRPIDVGTVLPHDSAFVRVDAPMDPGPGRFVASFRLTLSDGSASKLDAPIVVGEQRANGCVKADAAPAPQAPQRATSQVTRQPAASSAAGGPLGNALPAIVAGAAGLLLGATAIWTLRKP